MTAIALVLAIAVLEAFYPGLRTEEKSFGPVEQRFYLLLLDTADRIIAAGPDRHFRDGMTEAERTSFAELLHGIRFSEDCVLDKSLTVEGGISCEVNGRHLWFVDHGVH